MDPIDADGLRAWVDAAAPLLGLPVTDANRAEVIVNLQRIAAIARRLEAVELEPAVEPLGVFVR